MRKFLKRANVRPDIIITSTFKRAIQTAERMQRKDTPIVELAALDPDGDPSKAWAAINKARGEFDTVHIVTHGPLIEQLVAVITPGITERIAFEHNAVMYVNTNPTKTEEPRHRMRWYVTPKLAAHIVGKDPKAVETPLQEAGEDALAMIEHLGIPSKARVIDPLVAAMSRAVRRRFKRASSPFDAVYDKITRKAFTAGARQAMKELGPVNVTEAKRKAYPLPRLPDPARTAALANEQIDWTDTDRSSERALMIAEYEVSRAYHDGMASFAHIWRGGNGPVEKRWMVQPDACEEICIPNSANGWIDEEAPFDSGDAEPPGHPNCFLGHTCVSAALVSRATIRPYEGEIVILGVPGMAEIAVTPNHPILTKRGWIAAGQLNLGDYLAKCCDPSRAVALIDPHDNHMEAMIKKIPDALRMTRGVATARVPISTKAFHGDVILDGEVDIVGANSKFPLRAEWLEFLEQFLFGSGQWGAGSLELPSLSAKQLLAPRMPSASGRFMRGGSKPVTFFRRSSSHADVGGIASTALLKPGDLHMTDDSDSGDSNSLTHRLDAFARLMRLVQLCEIRHQHFSGHVYNLETAIGFYLAESIITHNCRCSMEYRQTPEGV